MKLEQLFATAKGGDVITSKSDPYTAFKAVANPFDSTMVWLRYQKIGSVVQVKLAIFCAKDMRKTDYEVKA